MAEIRESYESVETVDEMAVATDVFRRSLERFQQLGDLPSPKEDSVLAIEDVHTQRVPISAQVLWTSARARDALEAFRDLSNAGDASAGVLRPFAHYALIRQACEAAALGQWLLRPHKKMKRVLRSLNLEFTHAHDAHGLLVSVNRREKNTSTEQLTRTIRRLNELKSSVSQLREIELKRIPSWTDVLTDVSPPIGKTADGHALNSPLIIWKIASAFLHGSSTSARLLSDLSQVSGFDDRRMAEMELKPSWRVLAPSFQTCVQQLLDLYERYDFLATHDYADKALSKE